MSLKLSVFPLQFSFFQSSSWFTLGTGEKLYLHSGGGNGLKLFLSDEELPLVIVGLGSQI